MSRLVLVKRLLALTAVAGLAGAGTASAVPEAPLQKGDHGPAVQRLQQELGLPADGIFGDGTLRAVRRLQRVHAAAVDGVVGPATWTLANRSAGRRAHPAADRAGAPAGAGGHHAGSAVRLAQRRLGLVADGGFGPQTLGATRAFQRTHGLLADGVIGPATWAALGVRGRHPVLDIAPALAGPGPPVPAAVGAAIAAANRIDGLPYVFGGGHRSFAAGGYDCSGAVSYVLHGAGLLATPLTSGQLTAFGEPGPGRWMTVYANAGHAFLVINGRRFDATGGAGQTHFWHPTLRPTVGYVARHPSGL